MIQAKIESVKALVAITIQEQFERLLADVQSMNRQIDALHINGIYGHLHGQTLVVPKESIADIVESIKGGKTILNITFK